MKEYSFYCETFGCQMNAYDTEVIESMLSDEGFKTVSSPDDADIILVNTCSVREHAENRAINRLAELARKNNSVTAVCGCMAQRMGKRLFDRVDGLNIIAGTMSYRYLPSVIREAIETGGRFTLLAQDDHVTYALRGTGKQGSPVRYLSITRGCENYCSYCIVPYLRGKVRSKGAETILRELEAMIEGGTKEVTLLGQNVMSYESEGVGFPGLLEIIFARTAIRRVRYLTTHPRDVRGDVFRIMAEDERLCPHIHLPVQAGSNRILELMNRGYTREEYLATIDEARAIVPGLSVTTDIIVGFPSETDGDFQDTMELIEAVRFDSAFTFKYSPREGTAAAQMADDVPLEIKKRRLATLNETIRDIRRETLERQIGSITEILLDGQVQIGNYQFLKGRTPHFRNVLVPGDHLREGDVVPVKLTKLQAFTLVGEELARR